MSLLRRVFLVNAALVGTAAVVLAVTPASVSESVTAAEVAGLCVALVLLLGANLVALRRLLLPLQRLTDAMAQVDPEHPGVRVTGVPARDAEVAALTDAFNAMLDRLEGERRRSARLALAAQEGERRRVARELHDGVGQTLTAVTLRAERAADGPPETMPGELVGVADAVRESLEDVRRIARELRPEALDDLGLGNALIALAERLSRDSGVHVDRRLPATIPALRDELELVVYRVAQEALTNVVRHSGARNATMVLDADPDRLLLEVSDDGAGLPPGAVEGPSTGIPGMRERALLVGGDLEISSPASGGTRVRLSVPLETGR